MACGTVCIKIYSVWCRSKYDLYILDFQLEKVLQQGDISEVAEPYMKDERVSILVS